MFQNVVKEKIYQPVVDSTKSLGVKIHTTKVKDKQKFQCSAGDLYRALTDQDVRQLYNTGTLLLNSTTAELQKLF